MNRFDAKIAIYLQKTRFQRHQEAGTQQIFSRLRVYGNFVLMNSSLSIIYPKTN